MNKQIIINVTLAVLVITCAIIALAISQQAERTSQQYIDPDSKQEQKISSETKDNYTKKHATRIIVSDSRDRRNIDINRISSDRMSITIKQDNVIEFEKSNINITKTVRYRELRD